MGRGRETGYINVAVFGAGGAAAAEHLAKGWLVAVDGRLEYREWDTDAGKRHDYTVVGNVAVHWFGSGDGSCSDRRSRQMRIFGYSDLTRGFVRTSFGWARRERGPASVDHQRS